MPGVDVRQIETLDEVAARALPATDTQDVAGWIVRSSPGLAAKRANSVWPRRHGEAQELDEKLAGVERFYADRGLPARYQVSPASQPAGLERALRQRGYLPGAPTAVSRCDLALLAGQPTAPRSMVRIAECASDSWWATWQTALRIDASRLDAVAALFDRISAPMAFCLGGFGGRRCSGGVRGLGGSLAGDLQHGHAAADATSRSWTRCPGRARWLGC